MINPIFFQYKWNLIDTDLLGYIMHLYCYTPTNMRYKKPSEVDRAWPAYLMGAIFGAPSFANAKAWQQQWEWTNSE